MALGIGYGLPFVAQHGTNPYKTQWAAAREGAKGAGATVEDENAGAGSCLVSRGQDVYTDGLPFTPSLLIVPQFYKDGNLYQDVPPFVAEDSTMRFTVTRATTATRVNSSGNIESVASGVPRIDWLGQSCPALLVEPSGTNGILNSTDTATNWTLGANLTSGAIDVIGVTGNNITVAVSGSNIGSAAGCHQRQNNNITLTSGSTYTISFFIKKTGAHTIGGFFANTSGTTNTAFGSGFDVSGIFNSGSLIQSSPITNRIRRVEQWGTDVYRCSETFTMTATNVLTNFRLGPIVSVTDLTNSAVGTLMGFAAPQLELGSVPTTYIPTTTGSASRNADQIVASGALVSGLIGQTEGTLYAEVDIRNMAKETWILQIDDGSNTNRIVIRSLTTNLMRGSINATTTAGTVAISSAAFTSGIVKIAFAYKSGDLAVSVNGATALTANGTFTFGSSLNRVLLGGGDTPLNDRIRAAALYTTRLTNEQLAQLTRL